MAAPSPTGSPGPNISAPCDTPQDEPTDSLNITEGKERTTLVTGLFRKLILHIESFLPRLKRPFRKPQRANLSAVVVPHQTDDEKLDTEDFIRLIELFAKIKYPDGARDRYIVTLPAKFDFGFDEGSDASSYILLNRSILQDLDLPADLITEYEDPQNPPVRIENPDGTNMKLYGEFTAKWAIRGYTKKYENQKVFYTGQKFIKSRCLLMGEESRFSGIVGWNTIHQNQLDQEPAALVASLGSRSPPPSKDDKRVQQKAPLLAKQQREQAKAQDKIEAQKRDAAKRARMSQKAKDGKK